MVFKLLLFLLDLKKTLFFCHCVYSGKTLVANIQLALATIPLIALALKGEAASWINWPALCKAGAV